MSRADRDLPHGMFPTWFTPEGSTAPRPTKVQTSKGDIELAAFDRLTVQGFPFFKPANDHSRQHCSRCARLLAAVVVHPLGLALVVYGRRSDDVNSADVKRLQERTSRDAARHAGTAIWGEWVDEMTDLSPVQAWCPRHRAEVVDVSRLVAAARRT